MSSRLSQMTGAQGEEAPAARRLRLAPVAAAYGVFCLLLIGVAVLAARYHASVSAQLTESAITRHVDLAQLAAATLSERLDRMADLSVSLATRVRFAELVAAGNWEAAVAILDRVPEEFAHVERVFLADVHGTLMADVPPLPGVRGRNFASRDWYAGVSRAWKTHISTVYRRAAEPQRNVIAVSTPVRARPGAGPAGILVAQLSLEAFFDWASDIDLSRGMRLSVSDAKGQAAYASGVPVQSPIGDLTGNPGVKRLRENRAGAQIAADAAGEERLYAFAPASHGWGVVIEQPARDAFAARDTQLRSIQVAYASVALLLAALAGLAVRAGKQKRVELERGRGDGHQCGGHDSV